MEIPSGCQVRIVKLLPVSPQPGQPACSPQVEEAHSRCSCPHVILNSDMRRRISWDSGGHLQLFRLQFPRCPIFYLCQVCLSIPLHLILLFQSQRAACRPQRSHNQMLSTLTHTNPQFREGRRWVGGWVGRGWELAPIMPWCYAVEFCSTGR